MNQENQKHWLYREENRRTLWLGMIAVLAISVLPELFMHHHANFEEQGIDLDTRSGFFPWYGFATCAVMVLVAKLLGYVLKRKDDYYDE